MLQINPREDNIPPPQPSQKQQLPPLKQTPPPTRQPPTSSQKSVQQQPEEKEEGEIDYLTEELEIPADFGLPTSFFSNKQRWED